MNDGGGDIRSEFTDLFDVYWAIGLGVWLLIALLALAFVVRYRARRGEPDEFPGGRAHNMPLELGYAAVVACVVALLVYLTYTTMDDPGYRATALGLDAGHPPADAEVVDVTGARWNWRFDYPRLGISVVGTDTRVPTLTLPEDRPVTLRMRSLDVIHAIWIPQRRFKQDVFPGRTTTMTLTFPNTGFWRSGGVCNQFCGLRHAEMTFDVRVLGAAEYAAWTRTAGR